MSLSSNALASYLDELDEFDAMIETIVEKAKKGVDILLSSLNEAYLQYFNILTGDYDPATKIYLVKDLAESDLIDEVDHEFIDTDSERLSDVIKMIKIIYDNETENIKCIVSVLESESSDTDKILELGKIFINRRSEIYTKFLN